MKSITLYITSVHAELSRFIGRKIGDQKYLRCKLQIYEQVFCLKFRNLLINMNPILLNGIKLRTLKPNKECVTFTLKINDPHEIEFTSHSIESNVEPGTDVYRSQSSYCISIMRCN